MGGEKPKALELLLYGARADARLIDELEQYAMAFPESREETVVYLKSHAAKHSNRKVSTAARKTIRRLEVVSMLEILAGDCGMK